MARLKYKFLNVILFYVQNQQRKSPIFDKSIKNVKLNFLRRIEKCEKFFDAAFNVIKNLFK